MKQTSTNTGTVRTALGRAAPVALALLAAAALWMQPSLVAGPLSTVAPLAGTTLGNQASAVYTDASNIQRTATSNTVVTVVQQIASLTLATGAAKAGAPGSSVTFPHTLTNTGNGTDVFTLTLTNATGDNFDLSSLTVYADANGDGVPDNSTPVSNTGSLAPGGIYRFLVSGVIPGSRTSGDQGAMTITAASQFSGSISAVNTDTATVTGNAVVNVTKAISSPSGASPSGPYTITFTYTNTGNVTATAFALTDQYPTGMTYVAGSGRWSVTGAAELTDLDKTDAQGTSPNTIIYDHGVTQANTVTAAIGQVPPGFSGTLSFQVNVNSGLAPQTLNNTASYRYNDGSGLTSPANTNMVGFTVNQSASLTLVGYSTGPVLQGAIVTFTNVLTNTGNGTDSFDITYANASFPAGTTFVIYRNDGNTPMTDTNGNNVPDTGPLAAGASYNVVIKAILPPGVSGSGPYVVNKTARSVYDTTVYQTVADTLSAITANIVDLTENHLPTTAPFYGTGPGPEASPVEILTVTPGATTRFNLYVSNQSGIADSYDMTASSNVTFGSLVLPAGWTVTFKDLTGAIVTNTGVINAGAYTRISADVSVPAGFPPGQYALYFRSLSPTTGVGDRLYGRVDVSTVRRVSITPNNAGQIFPGGSVVYTHTLSNEGNVPEGDVVVSTIGLATADNQSGWTSVIYLDSDYDNVLTGADTVVTNLTSISLTTGTARTLFVKVFSPAGAAVGSQNLTTLTVTTLNGSYTTTAPSAISVTDTSSVIGGQVRLEKLQALDASCDGTADGAFSAANLTTGALPGACIRYQITATNDGSANVTSLVVADATPPNTAYNAAGGEVAATTVGSIAAPSAGSAGTITATVGTLTPHQSAVVTFGVKINVTSSPL